MIWCRRRDSNSHSFRHYPLKIACLPISPRRRFLLCPDGMRNLMRLLAFRTALEFTLKCSALPARRPHRKRSGSLGRDLRSARSRRQQVPTPVHRRGRAPRGALPQESALRRPKRRAPARAPIAARSSTLPPPAGRAGCRSRPAARCRRRTRRPGRPWCARGSSRCRWRRTGCPTLPLPKAAPMSAPLPCWIRIRPIMRERREHLHAHHEW